MSGSAEDDDTAGGCELSIERDRGVSPGQPRAGLGPRGLSRASVRERSPVQPLTLDLASV